MQAIATGQSALSLKGIDLNADDKPDRGVLLRTNKGEIVGDTDGDGFFDGPRADAEIRVGSACSDPNAKVVKAEVTSATPGLRGAGSKDDGQGWGAHCRSLWGDCAGRTGGRCGSAYYMRSRENGSGGGAPTQTPS